LKEQEVPAMTPTGSSTSGKSEARPAEPKNVLPVMLVFTCTLIGAGAQVLFKLASADVPSTLDFNGLMQLASNVPLIGGLLLYGLNTVLMVLALRKGELSLLYPIISLNYVWVTIISAIFLKEEINAMKVGGLTLIIMGVVFLGLKGRR
jgi:multidrug transporter EmrE-like cation transporter